MLGTVIVTSLDVVIFSLSQFSVMRTEYRVASVSAILTSLGLFLLTYQRLRIIVKQIMYNYTQSETSKYITTRRMHFPYHYDTGDLLKNIQDAFR